MITRRFLKFIVGIVIIITLVIMARYRQKPDQLKNTATSEIPSNRRPQIEREKISSDLPDKRPDGKTKDASVQAKTYGDLQREVENVLGESEASRSRMLLESKRGENYCYLLGVERPSSEEVAKLRKTLSELASQASLDNKQKFDAYLQRMIVRYDCFGVEGKKGIYILIPENFETKSISGFTFSVDDFEAAKSIFDPEKEIVEFPFPNVKPYIRSDTRMLSRFKELIKTK